MSSSIKPRNPIIDWGNPLTKRLVFDVQFKERGGTTFKNNVSFGLDETIVGVPTTVVKDMGYGLNFNGVDSGVRTTPDTSFVSTTAGDFSMECWFIADSLPGTEVIPMSNGADNAGYSISIESSTLKVLFNGVARIATGEGMATNQLYHVILRHANGIVTLFKNGVNVGPNSANNPGNATEGLTMGVQLVNHTTFQRWFNGTIFGGRLWERALGDAEIDYLYRHPYSIYWNSDDTL